MDKMQIAQEGASLFSTEGLRASVEQLASSPKVAAVVATGTASMGALARMDMIQSAIGTASLIVGFITGCLVMCIQGVKLMRVYRSWTPNQPDARD
jgi:hypothetical protein